MGLVKGEDVILSIPQLQGATEVYVPIGCARSVTFDISTDFIETSVTESGSFKTFIPSGKQYSGNIEGLVFLDKAAVAETKATTILDFADFADSGLFPSSGDIFATITVGEPSSTVTLYFTTTGTFATFADFLSTLNTGINSGSSGYTSVISGETLVITARPTLGATINGSVCSCQFAGGISPDIENTFSGGVNGYYPSKIHMGWLYDKIAIGERIQLKYYETDDDNHFLQKVCFVYIESINETASFDNIVTFTASFKGDGAPIITYGEI